jgi:hypothetical protein
MCQSLYRKGREEIRKDRKDDLAMFRLRRYYGGDGR